MIKLTIRERLPNLNDYTRENRYNRYNGAKMKFDVEQIITGYILEQIRLYKAKHPVAVVMRWYEPNARRDKDGIRFAEKFIFDALVERGILSNDGFNDILQTFHWCDIDKDNPRVEVEIYEQEEAKQLVERVRKALEG